MSDKITTDGNSVSYPNKKPGPDARIANPSPANQIVYRGNQEFTHIHISHTGEKICLECGADWNKGDSQAGDDLIQQLGDICHEHYYGCNQNPSTPDGYEYAYDNEVINLLDMPEARAAIEAYAERRATEARIAELQRWNTKALSTGIRYGYGSYIDDRISALTKEIQQ